MRRKTRRKRTDPNTITLIYAYLEEAGSGDGTHVHIMVTERQRKWYLRRKEYANYLFAEITRLLPEKLDLEDDVEYRFSLPPPTDRNQRFYHRELKKELDPEEVSNSILDLRCHHEGVTLH